MAANYVPNLGGIPDEAAYRDAVHVAVAPVVAGQSLWPGQHVGIAEGKAWTECVNLIGIVDPFRCGRVFLGERFWLLLYPGTVTNLRHTWQHSAFKAKALEAGDEMA